MSNEALLTSRRDGIATLTLSQPDKLNALSRSMITRMIAILDELERDDAVRALIVTGAGRTFCAGADLSGGSATFDYDSADAGLAETNPSVERDWGGLLTLRLFSFLKPIIAAINGAAVGVGATMVLPMDVRVASSSARFGFVFARLGIVPEAASAWFLPRIVGISTALEWCYSGRLVGADEAQARGLVRSLHAPGDLLEAAHALAREMTEQSAPVSIALTRQMMWRMLTAAHPMEAHQVDSRAVFERGRMADAREGIEAFLEKRKPSFTNQVSTDLPDVFSGWREPDFQRPTGNG